MVKAKKLQHYREIYMNSKVNTSMEEDLKERSHGQIPKAEISHTKELLIRKISFKEMEFCTVMWEHIKASFKMV